MTARYADVPETCRAAVLVARGEPLEVRDVPIPRDLEPGAILVRNRVATVCGTDVHLWRGNAGTDRPLPTILGHEMVGDVVALGPGVETDSIGRPLRLGDRITWTHGECGRCHYCVIEQQPTLCDSWRLYMVGDCREFPYLIGGFSEYTYVFPTSGRLKVPDDVPDAIASASSCALRTVVAAFDRLGEVQQHETVAIQGAGPVGLFAAAVAKAKGAAEVFVIGGPSSRLAVAEKWGAVPLPFEGGRALGGTPAEQVRAATGGRGADVVIEASGAPSAFIDGVDLVRRGGRYLIIGQAHDRTVEFNPSVIVMKQLRLIGSKSASVRHYHRAIEFLRRWADTFDWQEVVTNEYPLDRATEALEAMADWREIKPVLTMAR